MPACNVCGQRYRTKKRAQETCQPCKTWARTVIEYYQEAILIRFRNLVMSKERSTT